MQCKAMVQEQGSAVEAQCTNEAFQDGYCYSCHPDSRASRESSKRAADAHTCGNCVHYDADAHLPQPSRAGHPAMNGLCRADLPEVATDADASDWGFWPRVLANAWCGKWEQKV